MYNLLYNRASTVAGADASIAAISRAWTNELALALRNGFVELDQLYKPTSHHFCRKFNPMLCCSAQGCTSTRHAVHPACSPVRVRFERRDSSTMYACASHTLRRDRYAVHLTAGAPPWLHRPTLTYLAVRTTGHIASTIINTPATHRTTQLCVLCTLTVHSRSSDRAVRTRATTRHRLCRRRCFCCRRQRSRTRGCRRGTQRLPPGSERYSDPRAERSRKLRSASRKSPSAGR